MEGTEDWLVSDLIDGDTKEWCADIVCELFSVGEADAILKIPLSLRGPDDRLLWHYDSKGVFSVRSCYYVARSMPSVTGQHVASSSSGNGISGYWKRVWRANIPPKVRSFIWRLLKGFLPTRSNLIRKHVPLDSQVCGVCNEGLESELHLFKDCEVVAAMWRISDLRLDVSCIQTPSLVDWCMMMMDKYGAANLDIFFVLLWAIWKARNDAVWSEIQFDAWWIASWPMHWLKEYQLAKCVVKSSSKRPRVKWKFPPTGRLKINVDGSFHVDSGLGGLGVVVRDDRGRCVAALARHVSHATSAVHMEAMALRAGILLAVQEQWGDVEIECDCAVLAAAIARTDDDFSEIGCLVEDCRAYLVSLDSVQVQLVFREANCVANRLAKFASSSDVDYIWFDETPAIIQDVLYEDISHVLSVSRSPGFMSPPRTPISLN